MHGVNISEIVNNLRKLSPEKLSVVDDFVSYLVAREKAQGLRERNEDLYEVMLASEPSLRREWDTPEEDEAWADL